MQTNTQLSSFTLLLMISFASINAVLFTPALPDIANFFAITDGMAQLTITLFLVGYALGQLLYGPIANRYGRKPALYAGIGLQIFSSFLCVYAGFIQVYWLLVLGRFLLALGSAVGLKMTFTMVNETHEPKKASEKLSYIMIAFAVTPGLGIMVGGFLTHYFAWESTFYACAVYGMILLAFVTQLPETKKVLELDAFKLKHMIAGYSVQFKNKTLMSCGLMMGCTTSLIYIFAALAPFIAIETMHMNSATYGVANLIPPIGIVLGCLLSPQLVKKHSLSWIISLGIICCLIGSLMIFAFAFLQVSVLLTLFLPMVLVNIGSSLVFANAATIALSKVHDKAHGSAVMNFTSMGFVTIAVLSLSAFPTHILLLPSMYLVICLGMIALYRMVINSNS